MMEALTKRGTPRKRNYVAERARPGEKPWDRVRRHIAEDPETGCWVWQGALKPEGYAALTIDRKSGYYAHRIAYEEFIAPIPAGLQIDHLCRNRACCNPWHLEPVTPLVNTMRGESVAVRNVAKTHCPSGHLYDELNTRITARGCRQCITCVNRRNRKHQAGDLFGVPPHVVREWARDHGFRVRERGRISNAAMAAYVAAHAEAAA